jgi:hypothetical protein
MSEARQLRGPNANACGVVRKQVTHYKKPLRDHKETMKLKLVEMQKQRRAVRLPRLFLLLTLVQWNGVSGIERVLRQSGEGFRHEQDGQHLSYLELVDERRGVLTER